MHSPAYLESLPGTSLAWYTHTGAGELLAVYDHNNTQVRASMHDTQHSGRVMAHRYARRPEMCYHYDDTRRVVEQLSPTRLSYRYLYG